MTTRFRAQFDGHVFIPDGPVDLPSNQPIDLEVVDSEPQTQRAPEGLLALLADAEQYPGNPEAVTDGAAEHDHYLYGTPKRHVR